MTVRAPTYELTVGSRRWTNQVIEIDAHLRRAPLLDEVMARFPAEADLGAAVGDDVVVRLDGGDGAEDVFRGTLTGILKRLDETLVIAADAGEKLARYRPAMTLEQATAATVIKALCADVGASVGQLEDGPQLAYYAADPTRNAWEHAARVAAWGGAIVRVEANGKVASLVVGSGAADVALRYGRDVLSLVRLSTHHPIDTFVVAGESGVGAPDDPDALRPATDFFAGNRPDGPGASAAWTFEPALRSTSAARQSADGWKERYRAAGHAWRLEALLQPVLRPGMAASIDDLPDGFPGSPFIVDGVRHRIAPWTVVTEARLAEAPT
jgi:hypothetical protein